MTWKETLTLIDAYLTWLAQQMNADPQHGTVYQQRMAVLMLKRVEVLAKIEEESGVKV